MNVRLAKIFAGIGDGVLMLAALLAWWVIVMLLAGFVEIITGWNLILTTAGGVIIALVLPIGLTIAGYILLWKRARSLPLRSVMVAGGPAGAFKLFARAIGVLFAAYLIMWGVSAVVFGALVARQQKVLETMGLPRDWKAAMPAYQQHGNAGPLLWRVADSIKSRLPADGKSLPQLYSMLPALSDNPDTLKYLAPLIDRLETLNGPWLAKADSALACTLLVWKDYRAMSIDSVIAMRIPNYMGVQTLHRLYVLYAVKRAAAGDWSGCRRYFDKSNKLQSLLAQDPTLIGKMISLVNTGTTCEGLAVIEKIQRNRPESYALVTDVMKRMPPVDGSVRQGLVSEYSVFYGSWKSDKHSLMDVLSYTNGQMPQGRIVQLVWNTFRFTLYRLWEPWDRFCYLTAAVKGLEEASNRHYTSADDQRKNDKYYFDSLRRVPALVSAMVVPNYSGMYRREREAITKIDVVRMFAAAIEYKRTKGNYPATFSVLVPEYIPNVPKSAVDNSEFSYKVLPDRMLIQAKAFDGAPLPKYTVIKSH